MMIRSPWSALVVLVISALGCEDTPPAIADAAPDLATNAPVVTDESSGLLFTYVDDQGQFQRAAAVGDIPEASRGLVRVQDPRVPPGSATEVWIADLATSGTGGYAVRQGTRTELEGHARSRRPVSKTPAPVVAVSVDGGARPPVVMYMTRHCPVCHRARAWLNERGVAYVERDIETDRAAAGELRQKAARQGVNASGVPVFEVGGRLLPGFDPAALSRMLAES